MPLFRAETEAARASAWLGRILLVRPVSFTVLTVAALVMVVALAALFLGGEYTRKARVTGVLAPVHGLVRVVAPQAGVVEELRVREGERVERDAPLAALADRRAAGAREVGDGVAAGIAARRTALERQREYLLAAMAGERRRLELRRAGVERELAHLEGEMQLARDRAELALGGLSRVSELHAAGFVSALAVDRERDAALDHAARRQAMRRLRAGLEREAAELQREAEATEARARAQLASLELQRLELDQEALERAVQYRATVVAPAEGIVATVAVESGQMVGAGATVAALIPADATLEAHLFAPSSAIGFVRVGQEVRLRYLAYPHQKFGAQRGRIAAIARSPLAPAELGFMPPDGSREPLYRLKVALDRQAIDAYGRAEPLQAGLQVEADILLDRRALIEWVFEPLLSLAGRA